MKPQMNARLHTLLSAAGLTEQKKDLVFSFSGKESSKDMTDQEAMALIDFLLTQQPDKGPEEIRMDTMRKKLISLAYEMNWAPAGDWKKAMEAINKFCKGDKGKYKKVLNSHTYKELVHLTTQFNQLYSKYLKGV